MGQLWGLFEQQCKPPSKIVINSSGPFLVSRAGDAGWTEHQVKMPKQSFRLEPRKGVDAFWQ